MKTKISRISKRTLSLVLTMMLVVSMMLVGMVSVNAAISEWRIVGSQANNSDMTWVFSSSPTISGDAGSYTLTTNGNTSTIYFKLVAVENSNRYLCTANQTLTKGVKSNALSWYGGASNNPYTGWANFSSATTSDGTNAQLKYTPSSSAESVTFTVSNDGSHNYVTVTENGGTVTPTDKTWYVTGRFGVKDDSGSWIYAGGSATGWNGTATSDIVFTKESDTLYSLDTNLTVKDLSAYSSNLNSAWYLRFADGSTVYYTTSSSDIVLTSAEAGVKYSTGTTTNKGFYFNGTNTAGNVILYLDTSGTTPQFYFEIENSTPATDGDYTITGTADYGTLKFTGSANTTEGTANMGDTVTVAVSPTAGYACTGITVTGADGKLVAVTTVTATRYTFTMPGQNVTVAATFEESADKTASITGTDALYIDAAPSINNSSTLVKWHDYTFYMPKNVDLSNAIVYNGYSDAVTLNGVSIPAGGCATVSLSAGTSYGTTKGTVTVMQGSTDAMFLYTDEALPTSTGAGASKGDVKRSGGTCITMSNDTATPVFSDALVIDTVKGRGNSSWQASNEVFGKYAFNMKLDKKTNLYGMDSAESSGAKSWCLLANNADESMMRNAVAYQLAAEIGIDYAPEFRFVDIYTNGKYMGSYLVTEKVDVGNSKLVKGEAIDDINEDALPTGVTEVDETTNSGTYTYNGSTYPMQYATVCSVDGYSPDFMQGKYLLEFEITERYTAEASWFTSPKGQHVVVKSPEFATQEEVQYIAEKFAAMEAAIFASSDASLDSIDDHMDLDSFAMMYLVQELSSNLDAASTSYFMTFDCTQGDNARFIASPVWDYDWTFGQYWKLLKLAKDGTALDPADPEAWYVKNKRMDDSTSSAKAEYSIQSKLANNANFQSVIKKNWNNTFYSTAQKFYTTGGYIDQWTNQISSSIAMNEDRWGFISGDLLYDWGTKDTGDTFSATSYYLKTTWIETRVNWLNTEINKYADYTQTATPTLTAYAADGTTELTGNVDAGASYILKASTTETSVTFALYDGTELVEENTTGEFTIESAVAGEHNYTVKTILGDSEMTSDVLTINVDTVSFSISLSSDKSSYVSGESVTLTVYPTPANASLTYDFCYSNNNVIGDEDDSVVSAATTSTSITVTPKLFGENYFYVTATDGTDTVVSEMITVIVNSAQEDHTVRVYFKSPSAVAYTPSVKLNDNTAVTMTKDTDTVLGKTYSGSLTMYWYYADLTINSTQDNTLTFTTKRTRMNASITDRFNGDTYYLAVDDMMTGTEVVDLSNSPQYIRNYYHSATNMVYGGLDESDNTLGFTNVDGERMKMGSYIDDKGIEIFSIKSATLMQKLAVDAATVSDTQEDLLDVNLDGTVNVSDATLMQKALVSG